MTIFILSSINTDSVAIEVIDKIKDKKNNIIKILTRKSLDKEDMIQFISEKVITLDEKNGDGLVTYYFKDQSYQKYKDLEFIDEDKWKISMMGHLQIYDNGKKKTWKIQTGEINTINVRKKINSIGKLYEFSYEDKIDYYIKVEEEKLANKKTK